MKKNRILALSMSTALAMALAACGGPAAPKSAEELIGKYAEAMKEQTGYHVDMDMDFGIRAEGEGMTFDIPVEMDMSIDMADSLAHGDMGLSLSLLGQSMNEKAEVYVDGDSTYTYSESDGYWTVSDNDERAGIASGMESLDPASFENAEFAADSKAGTYTVTQSLADFAATGDTYDLLEDVYGGMAETMGMDADDLLDQWKDAKAVYVFDKDFLLQSMEIQGCEYSSTIEEDGVSMDVKVSLALSYRMSKYGEIDADSLKVPADVKDEATPSVSLDLGDDVTFGGMEDDLDPGFSVEPEAQDPEFPLEEEEPEDDSQSPSMSDGAGASLGTISGVRMTADGDSWADAFESDGWEFDTEDGEYSGIYCVNSKYPEAELQVSNAEMDKTTRADIENDGVFSYTVDFLFCEIEDRPNMDWNGVTFGDDAQAITDAYGMYDSFYNGDMWASYTYEFGDIDLTFYVTPDNGLQKVSVDRY